MSSSDPKQLEMQALTNTRHSFGYQAEEGIYLCNCCCAVYNSEASQAVRDEQLGTPCIQWVNPYIGIARTTGCFTLVRHLDGMTHTLTEGFASRADAMCAIYNRYLEKSPCG